MSVIWSTCESENTTVSSSALIASAKRQSNESSVLSVTGVVLLSNRTSNVLPLVRRDFRMVDSTGLMF